MAEAPQWTAGRRLAALFSSVQRYVPFHNGMSCVHLHKAVEPPAIIHHAAAYLPLAPFFLRLSLGVSSLCSSFAAAVIWERRVGSIGDQAYRCPLVGSYHVWTEAAQQEAHR